MINRIEKNQCSGCSACVSTCPKDAISMQMDEKGFYYPFLQEEKCVNCGLCDYVCPSQNSKSFRHNNVTPKAYAVKNKDITIRKASSSGGAFSVFAEMILSREGIVYGCAMDLESSRAHHIRINTIDQLCELRGSKYIYSELHAIFRSVKQDLDCGKEVLFSGTPCQVSGLKGYLNKEYSTLFCIDIVCHGIPSYIVWDKYISEKRIKFKKEINSLSFRSKRESWRAYGQEFYLDGKKAFYSKDEDIFLRLFLSDVCLRPSCYQCYVKTNKMYSSDITLGDFWSINRVDGSFEDMDGVSLVLSRTAKGDSALNEVNDRIIIKEEDYYESIEGNSVIEQTQPGDVRDSFWEDFSQMSLEELTKKYSPMNTKDRIKSILRKYGLYRVRRR